MGWLFSKKTAILVTILVILVLLMVASSRGQYSFPFLQGVVSTIMAPLQRVAGAAGSAVSGVGITATQWKNAYQENAQLRQEVLVLRQATLQMSEVQAENQRLAAMLDYKKNTPQFSQLVATVIGRDSGPWSHVMVINKGTSDGIAKSMPVVTPKGLVGSIAEAYPTSSKVTLLLDSSSAAGGLVQRAASRVTGPVFGSTSSPGMLKMEKLALDSDIVKGDVIITSGLGGVFPKGILVGQVEDTKPEQGGLLKYAELKPAVEFDKLEEVLVIISVRPEPVKPSAVPPTQNAPQQKVGTR